MIYNQEKKEIILNRELSELDKFAIKFLKIVEKHVEYLIISGYISILLGRARATEDIDVFIKKISFEQFSKLYNELKENDFWCLNAEDEEEIFDFLKEGLAIRFSRIESPIPNFEVKFPKKDELDNELFEDVVSVILKNGKLKISSLERHIAFKEEYLKSEKDIEDARHVRELFGEKIDNNKINKLKQLIKIRCKNGKKVYETWKDK